MLSRVSPEKEHSRRGETSCPHGENEIAVAVFSSADWRSERRAIAIAAPTTALSPSSRRGLRHRRPRRGPRRRRPCCRGSHAFDVLVTPYLLDRAAVHLAQEAGIAATTTPP